MTQVGIIGLDLAKTLFQVHGVDASGAVVVRRSLRRARALTLFAALPRCLVGLEACATAHDWGRELTRFGHDVRLMPPAYATAYVRRNKNDAADAAAICEAVSRLSMRFVARKSEAEHAAAGLHKLRTLLVKQHTMAINDGGGLARSRTTDRGARPADPRLGPWRPDLPALGDRARLRPDPGECDGCDAGQPRSLPQRPRLRLSRPGAASGGDWGKGKLGLISKRGNGYLRRQLVDGAMAVLSSRRAQQDPWLAKLLASKKWKVVACALAHKMARIAWAVTMRQEDFRTMPAAA